MKRQIRRGVYETNSSSVHSLTMCMKSDYDRWQNGELVWSRWDYELIPITDEIKRSMDNDERENFLHMSSLMIMIIWGTKHIQNHLQLRVAR